MANKMHIINLINRAYPSDESLDTFILDLLNDEPHSDLPELKQMSRNRKIELLMTKLLNRDINLSVLEFIKEQELHAKMMHVQQLELSHSLRAEIKDTRLTFQQAMSNLLVKDSPSISRRKEQLQRDRVSVRAIATFIIAIVCLLIFIPCAILVANSPFIASLVGIFLSVLIIGIFINITRLFEMGWKGNFNELKYEFLVNRSGDYLIILCTIVMGYIVTKFSHL